MEIVIVERMRRVHDLEQVQKLNTDSGNLIESIRSSRRLHGILIAHARLHKI